MEWLYEYVTYHIPPWYILLPLSAILLYWYLTKDFHMFDKYGITAGPKAWPWIGTGIGSLKHGIFEWDVIACRKWRDARVIRVFEFGMPAVFITDPSLAKHILVKEFTHFVNRKNLKTTTPPLNRSLIAIQDDHWRHVRNTVSPTFSGAKMKKMTPLIQKCSESLVGVLEEYAKSGETVNSSELFRSFTLDVIACTMFAMDVNSLQDKNHPFVQHATNLVSPGGWRLSLIIVIFLISPKLLQWLSKLGLNPQQGDLDYFTRHLEAALKERREEQEKYHDFLALMVHHEVDRSEATLKSSDGLMWTDKGLTKEDIVAQMVIFFFAGFDTTANTLNFVSYNMCIHEDLQRKLQQEVDEELAGEEPNYDNIHKLTYMDMFISETLRLYGPGVRVIREADVDIQIEGITIPKGVGVWLPFGAYHRDPDIWNDPDTFDPERFSAENKASREASMYMPFSHGPRNCVGMRLANLELRLGLARILQTCTLTLDPETPRVIKMSKWRASPEKPLKFKVTMRSD